MGKIIIVTSGKGGVGKTTVSIGLAAALCNASKRVLLVDADEGLRCLDTMLGADKKVMLDLSDAQADPENAAENAVDVDGVEGLSVIAAPMNFGTIRSDSFGEAVVSAARDRDFVIVDCPAGVDDRYYVGMPRDSLVLVVTNSDAAAVSGAAKARAMVKRLGFSEVRLVVNKFSRKSVGKLHDNIDAIVDKTEIGLIGVIPFDNEITVAAAAGKPAVNGRAAMAFARTAARLCGARVLLPPVKEI